MDANRKELIIDSKGLFSPRQEEAAGWIPLGKTNGEIAILMGCSERMAKAHTERAMHKVGAHDRTYMVTRMFELEILRFVGIVLAIAGSLHTQLLQDDLRTRPTRSIGTRITRTARTRLRRQDWLDENWCIETEVTA